MTLTITFSSAPSARDQEASVVLVRDDAASAWTRYGPEVITYSGTTATVTIPDRAGCQVQVRCGRLASPIITATSPAPYISLTSANISSQTEEIDTVYTGNAAGLELVACGEETSVEISLDGGATTEAYATMMSVVHEAAGGYRLNCTRATCQQGYDTILYYYQQGLQSGTPTQIRVNFIDSEFQPHATNWLALSAT